MLARRRGLGGDLLLRCAFQSPDVLRLVSQSLNGGKHKGPIGGERLTEERRPGDLLRHPRDDLREQRQSDKARLETRLHCGVLNLGAFQIRICLQPLVELADFRRIRCTHQDLCEQLVRIEGHRSEQLIERADLIRLSTRGHLPPGWPAGHEQHQHGAEERTHLHVRPSSHRPDHFGLSHNTCQAIAIVEKLVPVRATTPEP